MSPPGDELGHLTFGLADIDRAAPIEVRDDELRLIEDARVEDSVEVPSGTYFILSRLPSGRRVTKSVEVRAGEQHYIDLAPPALLDVGVEIRGLEPLGPGPWEDEFARDAQQPRLPQWYMRLYPSLVPPASDVLSIEAQEAYTVVSLALYAPAPDLQFLQLATPGEVPLSVALPLASGPASTCKVEVGIGETLAANVLLTSQYWPVAQYLRSGDIDSAAAICVDAERFLQGKMADPIGAALGGYALLRADATERLHDWPRNLATLFEWLPDGAIIAAEQAARTADHEQALELFHEALSRGLPIFTDGFSILVSRLSWYGAQPGLIPNRSIKGEAERIASISPFVDFSALTLTVRGAIPDNAAYSQDKLSEQDLGEGWRQYGEDQLSVGG